MSEGGYFLVGFFAISLLSGTIVGLVHSKPLARILTMFYVAVHIAFSGYAWLNLGETVLDYFTFDPLGVLLLSILSILTVTTVYHGFIYVKDAKPRIYAIYHAALIALVAAMSGAYLANGMTTVWIFVEATTLAVAALIYHDRTAMALEATWKSPWPISEYCSLDLLYVMPACCTFPLTASPKLPGWPIHST
jgi:hydrogenase-4 component F